MNLRQNFCSWRSCLTENLKTKCLRAKEIFSSCVFKQLPNNKNIRLTPSNIFFYPTIIHLAESALSRQFFSRDSRDFLHIAHQPSLAPFNSHIPFSIVYISRICLAILYCSCQCPHLCFNSLRKNPWNTGEDLPSIHQPGVIDGCLPLQGTCHTSCDSKTNTKALVAKQHSKISWTRTATKVINSVVIEKTTYIYIYIFTSYHIFVLLTNCLFCCFHSNMAPCIGRTFQGNRCESWEYTVGKTLGQKKGSY